MFELSALHPELMPKTVPAPTKELRVLEQQLIQVNVAFGEADEQSVRSHVRMSDPCVPRHLLSYLIPTSTLTAIGIRRRALRQERRSSLLRESWQKRQYRDLLCQNTSCIPGGLSCSVLRWVRRFFNPGGGVCTAAGRARMGGGRETWQIEMHLTLMNAVAGT